MRKNGRILNKKILNALLAGAMLSSCNYNTAWANSGGTLVEWKDCYIGNSSSGSDVVIDENNSSTSIYGGTDATNAVTDNTVTVVAGAVAKDITGGIIETSANDNDVKNNSISIEQGAEVRYIKGGLTTGSGVVEANTVTIAGIAAGITGGDGGSSVRKNKVVIERDSDISGPVYGGKGAAGSKVVEENEIVCNGGKIVSDLCGGNSDYDALVQKNIVTATGDTKVNYIYGGSGANGSVTANQVIVGGNAVLAQMGRVIGGYIEAGSGDVTENTVTITENASVQMVIGGFIDNGAGAVRRNVLTFNSGTANANIYGGYSKGSGVVEENRVIINAGTLKSVYGGYGKSNVNNNYVEINGGSFTSGEYGSIYGGYSTSNGDATGNTLVINGGNFIDGDWGKVWGGFYGGYSKNGSATGNSVTIASRDGVDPLFDTVIYGGFSGNADKDVFSGNTLNIHTKNLTTVNVKNFEYYNFYLPEDISAGETVLTLTDKSGTDLSGSKINVGVVGSAPALQAGDKIYLFANKNGIKADAGLTYGKIQQGVSVIYDFGALVEDDGKKLSATVNSIGSTDGTGGTGGTGGKVTEQSKSPVETRAAASAVVNSGADNVSGTGIANAVQAAGGNGQAEMFGASSGGNMRYKSGSYTDVHGYNLALGAAKAVKNNAGKLTYGPFAEYGWGNYTSHLDSGVRSDGNTKYYGVGAFVRQDNNNGVYYDGSLRYGRLESDYRSGDMIGADGNKVYSSYDSSSSYYGAHLGVGKVSSLDEKVRSDIYLKVLYNHQGSDSVALGGKGNGEVYEFDAVDSTRARVGGRLSKDFGKHGTGYVGMAYEYEFDGTARATVKGLSTHSPSIKGSSGMFEIGYVLKADGENGTDIELGLQNWLGKKQGVTASVNVVFKF